MPTTLPVKSNDVPPNRRWVWPFELIEQIGEGGMGVVYRGRYVVNNREVAVKMLPADVTDKTVLARFERELEVLKGLRHTNIVRCFGGVCEDKARFYAMELITGGTLESELQRRGKISWEMLISYGEQMCAALEAAHKQGVVHRDVKPSNFLMTPEGQLKLSDFGLAMMEAGRKITQAGKTAGTFLYMAPEQIRGQEVTGRTDLYALGCVFYELLTGKPPFIGETPAATLHMHLKNPVPRVGTTVLDCPPALDELVSKLMEKDPANRYQSAADVARALEAITPTIVVRNPKRNAETPTRGLPTHPVVRKPDSDSTSTAIPRTPAPHWLPTALTSAFVLSLLINASMLSSLWSARAWERTYIDALKHPNPAVRIHAAEELGKSASRSSNGMAALIDTLKDSDSNVRVAAATAVGMTGRAAKDFVPALIRVQKESDDPQTRSAAAEAVKQINEAPRSGNLGGTAQILMLLLGLGGIAFVAFRDSAIIEEIRERARAMFGKSRGAVAPDR
jgi:serine/threonine-protein kinase